ncbi:uncharacterized protein LACBIDRAFT_296395 [Laccaria bicolor S238N-H82]|uniref:Predicted protein n=1 Tax=Laccaria bicolor (strain S238N-H82 / ATCC MYA-4686) TaxID=486041 RepID=B0D8P6_LACBS|nr:uncharacterized protein LACBIDRAFT_296395 [Laccaria bicolor S238N-H82]EDR08877.1 predicted protein [Laccaria bicolor S238N-H82]|eukprot:XP_001880190.1 predicted protein [Laccaria bicolor S238N-H82]
MSSPYQFTPRVPAAPHPTPHSVSAYTSQFQGSTRPPIHNPYDKFTQPEFDAWIGGITGALRKALGQVDEEPPKNAAPQEDGSLSYPDITADFSLDDYPAEDSFAEIKARRVVRKGKERDPREGPGLGVGNRDQPIELGSSSEEEEEEEWEEEEEGVDDEDGDDENELSHIFDEAASSDNEDYWKQGQASTHVNPRVKSERYVVDEEEDDDVGDDEGEEEGGDELLSSCNESGDEAEKRTEAQLGAEEVIELIPGDELIDYEHAGAIKYFEEDEEGGPEQGEAEFDDSEREYSDNEGHDTGTPHPLAHPSYVLKSVQADAEAGVEQIEVEPETDQPVEDNIQPLESDTSFPPHDTEQDELPVELPDPWEGPQTYAEDFYAGGDARVAHAHHPNPHFLEEPDVDEIHEEDVIQPADKDTSFPSHSASDPEVFLAIEIPNPWEGPETYAEDYYAGGDLSLVPGPSVDPNYLGEEDEDSNQFIMTTDNGETTGTAILKDGDRMVEGTNQVGHDIAGEPLVRTTSSMSPLEESKPVEVVIVELDQGSAPAIETSMQEAKPCDIQGELESDNLVPSTPPTDRLEMEIGASPGGEMDIDSINHVGTDLETASEEATAAHEGKKTAAASDLPSPVLAVAPPSEDKIVSTQFIDTEENLQTFAVSKSVETVEQTPDTAPHETVTEVFSEVDAHYDGEDVAVSGEDENVEDFENVLFSEKELDIEARPKEDEEIVMKEETTSVVHERDETVTDICIALGESGHGDEVMEESDQLPALSSETPRPTDLPGISREPPEILPSQDQDQGPSLDESDPFDKFSASVEVETQQITITGYTVIEDEGSVTSEDAEGEPDWDVDILSVSTDFRQENDEPPDQVVDAKENLNDLHAKSPVSEAEEPSISLETEVPSFPDAHQVEAFKENDTLESATVKDTTIIDATDSAAPSSKELTLPAASSGFATSSEPDSMAPTSIVPKPNHEQPAYPSESPSSPGVRQGVTDFVGNEQPTLGPESTRPNDRDILQTGATSVSDSSILTTPSASTEPIITRKPPALFLCNDPYPYSLSTPGIPSFIEAPKEEAPEEEDTEQDNSMSSNSTFDKILDDIYLNHIPDHTGDVDDSELQYPTEPGLWSEAAPESPLSFLPTTELPPSTRRSDADSGHAPDFDRNSITTSQASVIDRAADEDPFKSMGTDHISAQGEVKHGEFSLAEVASSSPTVTSIPANGGPKNGITSTSSIAPQTGSSSQEIEPQALRANPLDVDDVYTSGHGLKRKRSSSPKPSRLTRTLQSKSTDVIKSVKEKTNVVDRETDEETIRVNPRPKGKGKGSNATKKQTRNTSLNSTTSWSSSGVSSAARFFQPDNQTNSPASSVVSSAASDTMSMTFHPSPTICKPGAVATRPSIPPNPLFHAHGQKRKETLQLLSAKAKQQQPQHQTLIGPSFSSLSQIDERLPSTSTSFSATGTNLQALPAIPPPPPPTSVHVKSSNSPVTRSHCRYHKISVPKEEGGPRVCFLVPGCSLNDKELMEDEEIEDHGDATHDDSLRMVKDVETLDFDAYLIGTLRQLVGLDILREQEVFYLPSPGEEVTRKVLLRRSGSERMSLARNTSSHDYSSFAGSPGYSIRSPASTRAPASVAGSSTSFSARRKAIDSDKDSTNTAHLSDHDSLEDYMTDMEFPETERPRPSPSDKGEGGSMGPPGPKSLKSRQSKRFLMDTPYQPTAEDEADTSNDDSKARRKSQVKKRGVKRTRTNEGTDAENFSRKAKKQRSRSKKIAVDTRTDSQSSFPQPPILQQPSPLTPSIETDGHSMEKNRLPDPTHNVV